MRRYGKCAANRKGRREDRKLCIVEVPLYPGAIEYRQCQFLRKEGDLCTRHRQQLARGSKLRIPKDEKA